MSDNITPLLLTWPDDFEEDKLIPRITDTERVVRCIRDAQEFDLRTVMGDRFYTDMILNFDLNESDSTEPYVALMGGVDYTDADGYTIHFPGLRMALKFWTYARYISDQHFNVTSHSIVTKLQENSQPVSTKAISEKVEQARSGAMHYWSLTLKYLKKHATSFPLWTGAKTEPRGSFKIRVGGKDN